MAQTNYTPISLYYSTTASAVPTAANLVPGELAINTNDGKLYYEDSSGVVQVLASKATSSGTFTTISVSGVATFSAGTVSLPAITTTGDTNTGIFFPAADTIAFTEGGAEAMRINSSGQVGIGTSSPGSPLTVSTTGVDRTVQINSTDGAGGYGAVLSLNNTGTGGREYNITSTSNADGGVGGGKLKFYDVVAGATRMLIDASGNLLVGTTSQLSSALLSVDSSSNGVTAKVSVNSNSVFVGQNSSGTVTFNVNGTGQINSVFTSITAISDARLKTNIQTIKYGLDAVTALKPVMFDFIENDLVQGQSDNLGFIAQNVQSVIPELVTVGNNKAEDGSPYLTLKMGDMLPVLVKAIQEQQALIESLTTRLTALENK